MEVSRLCGRMKAAAWVHIESLLRGSKSIRDLGIDAVVLGEFGPHDPFLKDT